MSKDGININSTPTNFTRPLKPPGITTVTSWMKPSELPNKFHKDVWITKKYFHDSEPVKPFIAIVQNHYRGRIPEMWNGEYWEFISDTNFRIMLLYRPDSSGAFGVVNEY